MQTELVAVYGPHPTKQQLQESAIIQKAIDSLTSAKDASAYIEDILNDVYEVKASVAYALRHVSAVQDDPLSHSLIPDYLDDEIRRAIDIFEDAHYKLLQSQYDIARAIIGGLVFKFPELEQEDADTGLSAGYLDRLESLEYEDIYIH